FTTGPTFTGGSHPKSSCGLPRRDTHRSPRPTPPSRLLLKNIHRPSREKAGWPSLRPVLTTGPRFIGGFQGLSTVSRFDSQMSAPPNPPGRSEVKYKVRSSLEIAGPDSVKAEFTRGPRL